MADNTLNFDLDAPAVPTLTLDPTPAAVPQEEKPAAAPAPEAQVNLTPEEQAMVDQFAQKIDITNSQQVLQYGSACQKKIGDFSEAALSKVSTKDLGEVGDMITDLIGELKSFDANEEQQKGIMGFFKKKTSQLDALKTKYDKTETNVEKIQSMLEAHQVQLLKDIAMLDKMYELNMAYFKELSMYILAGKKKLADVRANELQQAMDITEAIDDTGHERRFGPYHREVDLFFTSKGKQSLDIGILDRHTLGLTSDTRIAGSAIYLRNLRRTRQRIDDGMFAATAAYD